MYLRDELYRSRDPALVLEFSAVISRESVMSVQDRYALTQATPWKIKKESRASRLGAIVNEFTQIGLMKLLVSEMDRWFPQNTISRHGFDASLI
jgi:hypothetical protein